MATLHLMIGLPCSGKRTYTKQFEKEYDVLWLTLDVWQTKLFGHNVEDPAHDIRYTHIEEII